jgi:hypothetical protein
MSTLPDADEPEDRPQSEFDAEAIARRRDHAWKLKGNWSSIVDDVYDFCMPYRRSEAYAQGDSRTDHLFDNTGIVSTFHGAGQLQQDLFPPGVPFWKLEPGPVTKNVLKATRGIGDNGGPPLDDDAAKKAKADADKFDRELDNISNQVKPFFLTGEWDNGVSELCLELYVGTGCMLILEGEDRENPVRFVTLSIDEVALEAGPYGDVGGLFWKTRMSRRAIKAAFPRGKFDREFEDALEKAPDDEIVLNQDFVAESSLKQNSRAKGWRMIVTIESDKGPIVTQKYKTRPFIAARYFRVPGETNGRGPSMLALPTIKTVNKVMEITLKAAAIKLLGIWGYRPGGTFNPDTARIAPGQWWPMQATGGIMGPDVTRIDASAGDLNIANIVLNELRGQIQGALHDEQLPSKGATPASAAEIVARMARIKQNYVGAFGRMIHEIIPVVIPRVMEILFKRGLITSKIALNPLLVAIKVTSPIAQALKADHYRTTIEAMQLVAQLEGPPAVARRFKVDELIPMMIKDLGVESTYVRTAIELAQYDKDNMAAQQEGQVTEAMLAKPDKFAAALSPQGGVQAPPPGLAA